jgi:hypothetical protein
MTASVALGYLVGTGAIALFVAYQGSAVDNALQRFDEVGGLALRFDMWRDALRVSATAPWIGVGLGDYAAHQYWVASAGSGIDGVRYVHNQVLQTAAELGWPMAIALVAIGTWWLFAQARERAGVAESALAGALLVVIGLHSTLEWPLASLHFAIPAALLFALAEPRVPGARPIALDSRLLVFVGVAGVLLALPMKLEFDELSDVTARADMERRSKTGITESTVMRMLSLGETARLRVYADNLLVYVRAPAAVQATDYEIERHERLLIAGAEPRLVARLVILYAKAGRMEESVRNAERLRIFRRVDYPGLSKVILDAVEPLGEAAEPLRRELAAGAIAAR